MPTYGTLMSWDVFSTTQQPVATFTPERAWENLRARLDIQNARLRESLNVLADFTTDIEVPAYGLIVGSMELFEIGEGPSTPPPQKIGVELGNMGFPLRRYSATIQWDRDYIENATVQELAAQTDEALRASRLRTQVNVRRAIFQHTNYSFRDRFMSKRLLAVKALVNADGMPIPYGPNGETFNEATHTHYLATASLTAGDVTALVNTVGEHWEEGRLRLYINTAQEPALTAMPNFTPFPPENVTPVAGQQYAIGGTLDPRRTANRDIGLWNGYVLVTVRQWMPAGYMFCINEGQPKPLVVRERRPGSAQLRLIAEYDTHPLQARKWLLEMGVAVKNRLNGAVLYIGGGSYVAPTITS